MWTSTLELQPRRVLLTRLLGSIWPGAYFSSFAPLQVQNVPRQPLPASNWVRVRNRLAGICGSDLHLIYADGDFRIAPAALPAHKRSYPGHEVIGEVIEIGEDVTHVQVGDHVALQHGPNCDTEDAAQPCRACASGNYSLCERGHFSGPEPMGGGWSEEMLVHERQLFRVPNGLTDEQAVLLEPSAVAVHTVLRHVPRPNDNVLIIGAGTIGLLTLQVVRALAPQAVVSVMARHSFQVEQATRLGAAHILYPQDSYKGVEQITGAKLYRGMFGNKMLLGGYDVIYDTIGAQQTLHDALRWTRAGGVIVVVGVNLHRMRLDLTPVWYQEVSLIGTIAHGIETWPLGSQERRSTFAIAADLIEEGQIHPEKLVTHRYALTDFRDALTTAAGKAQTRAIKVVFDYALMPASAVPNVRTAARQRRPVITTAAWPGDQGENASSSQPPVPPVNWDDLPEEAGQTWSQWIRPLPYSDEVHAGEEQDEDMMVKAPSLPDAPSTPTPAPQADVPVTPGIDEPVSAPTAYVTEEPIPPHLMALSAYSREPAQTDEPALREEQDAEPPLPAFADMQDEEPGLPPFSEAQDEEPGLPAFAEALAGETPTEQAANDERASSPQGPQPIILTMHDQEAQSENEGEKTVVVSKSPRARSRGSSTRKTTGNIPPTNS